MLGGKNVWQITTVGSLVEKLWRIEVHLQCDLMSDGTMVECQSMDMHIHAWNSTCLIQWKPKPYCTGDHLFARIGFVQLVQYVAIYY